MENTHIDEACKFKILKPWDVKLNNLPSHIPCGILNEHQAMVNHGQTLMRLNERGGLSPEEAVYNIRKMPLDFRNPGTKQHHVDELNMLVDNYYADKLKQD